MACFSLAWIEQLLIWLVIVVAVVAILKLFLPWLLNQLDFAGDMLIRILNIVLWAFICICAIYFVFALLSCLGGGGFPLFPHH